MPKMLTRRPATLAICAALALTAPVIAGCGAPAAQNPTPAESTQGQAALAPEATVPATPTSDKITEEAALDIALSDAGLVKSDVTVTSNRLETDDGVQVYEIEFTTANTEHDYTIDAATGQILERDNEAYTGNASGGTVTQDASATTPSAGKGISVDAAKAIAAEHAGFSADKVTFIEAKADTDDGVRVFDVSFRASGHEYDYEIEAATGAIRSAEKDID